MPSEPSLSVDQGDRPPRLVGRHGGPPLLWRLARYGVIGLSLFVLVVLLLFDAVYLFTDRRPLGDFSAFYTVGHILNAGDHPPSAIYDAEVYRRTYFELFPWAPPQWELPYAHAPFEAAIFRPFALLPYDPAFVVWQLLSLALFWSGVGILGATVSLGVRRIDVAVSMLLYLPFILILTAGQVSGIAFFAMACCLALERRGRSFAAGAALAVCLNKPTLLVLILPMLVLSRRGRLLGGFAVGAAALAVASVLVVGFDGCLRWVRMLLSFGGSATAAGTEFKLSIYVDLNAFVRALGGSGTLAMGALVLAAVVSLPLLARAWWLAARRGRDALALAWATAIAWSMLLNLYFPQYDSVLMALAVMLSADVLRRRHAAERVPRAFMVLLVVLYAASWAQQMPLGGDGWRLQVLTLALAAWATYLLWLASARNGKLEAELADPDKAD